MRSTGGDAAKPGVLLYGNCQAGDLYKIVSRMPGLCAQVRFHVIQYHMLREADAWRDFDDAFFDGLAVVWEQLGSDYTEERAEFRRRIRAHCRTVRFPSYSMMAMWPLQGPDPRLGDDPDYPDGRRYRSTDILAAAVAQEYAGRDASDDELFDRYMRLSAERMPNLERRLQLDHAQWAKRDAEADIATGPFVSANFRHVRLFHDHSHVSARAFRYLLGRLIEETLAGSHVDGAAAQAELDRILAHNEGQEWAQVPIHPLVAERLGLAWYDPDQTYLWKSHEFTFRDYVLHYIRWKPYVWNAT